MRIESRTTYCVSRGMVVVTREGHSRFFVWSQRELSHARIITVIAEYVRQHRMASAVKIDLTRGGPFKTRRPYIV